MTRPDLRIVTDADNAQAHTRQLEAAVRNLESAARTLVDTVDLRKKQGWHKTPMEAVEHLRDALTVFQAALHSTGDQT